MPKKFRCGRDAYYDDEESGVMLPFSTSKQKVWLGAAISLLNMLTLIPVYCRPSARCTSIKILQVYAENHPVVPSTRAIFLRIYATTKKYEL